MTTFASHTKVPALSLQALADITDPINAGWITYPAVWSSSGTAVALGNGDLTANYLLTGHLLFYFIRLTWGTTTTGGTGGWLFTAPTLPSNANIPMCGYVFDTSATLSFPAASRWQTVSPYIERTYCHTSAGVGAAVTATHPMTWATGDQLCLTGAYNV